MTLGDVARVSDGIEERRTLAFIDGGPAVGVDVLKQSGANTVAVIDSVKAALVKVQRTLPPGVSVTVVRDTSKFIRESVDDVVNSLVLGGVLTILIVFLFLNSWRSTVITGLTLPISVISSFIVMNFMGMTLNMLTLMALSLSIGMLIDDAIVVRENIVRHLEMGKDHFTAAREGTAEIGLAVLATSLSIVAVFVPVAFMKGIVGRFFFSFGITVAWAVLVSLLVSFTLDPMLSSRWVDPSIGRHGKRNLLGRFLDGVQRLVQPRRRALPRRHRLGARPPQVGARAGDRRLRRRDRSSSGSWSRASSPSRTAASSRCSSRAPPTPRSRRRTPGWSRSSRSSRRSPRSSTPTARSARATPPCATRWSTSGSRSATSARAARSRSSATCASASPPSPGCAPRSSRPGTSSTARSCWSTSSGDDLAVLKRTAGELKEKVLKIPGIVDVGMTLQDDIPEYRFTVDRRKASDLGLTTAALVRTVGTLIGGTPVTTWENEDGDAVQVRLRLPAALRENPEQIGRLRLAVPGADGRVRLIPLGEVLTWQVQTTPSQIARQDLSRQVVIGANLDGLPIGTAVEKVKKAAATMTLPPGYKVGFSGEAEDMAESFGYMGEALLLAVLLVYLILAAQFESFLDPLAIMISLPLAIVGVAGMLLLTRDTISIMSFIGLIMLMGLVTKNAILLVAYAKTLRAGGMARREALITAGRTRLRPIMMTTLAMIGGMLPMALGLGAGAEMRAPMARAVTGGLITSTAAHAAGGAGGLHALRRFRSLDPAPLVGFRQGPLMKREVMIHEAIARLPARRPRAAGGAAAPPGPRQAAGRPGRSCSRSSRRSAWPPSRAATSRRPASTAPRSRPATSRSAPRRCRSSRSRAPRSLSADASQEELGLPERTDNYAATLGVVQPLFTWGQIGAALRLADIGRSTAGDRMASARGTALRDAAIAFYDVLLAREFAALAAQNLEQRERHLEEARRRLAAGHRDRVRRSRRERRRAERPARR